MRAFYERFDGLRMDAPEPRDRFVVYGLDAILVDAREWNGTHDPFQTARLLVPSFRFPVSPDGYTKAGFSGGPAIGFELPSTDEDPRLDTRGRPWFST